MTDYYTDADHIRDTLDKYGPLTRAELADKTNLPRETLAKSLYALKNQGDVIEEGDRLMLTKAPETAQDTPEAVETGVGSTPAVESGTGAIPFVYEARPADALEAVNALAEEYRCVVAALLATRKENEQLREEMRQLRETNNRLLTDSLAYIALKEKLRGMLDD